VHHRAENAVGDLLADRVDGRRPAEREADRGHPVGLLGRVHHRLGVGDRRCERLLAQDVLPRGEQRLDDRTVQVVGDHHAHRVDVGCRRDRLPAGLGTLVAVPLRRVDGEGLVGVGDGDQPDLGKVWVEHRRRGAVPVEVRPAGHPGPDHGDPDR
jgi:hypothetical protein